MRRKGFTILEVLIAITLLTVGLLGFVTTAALVTRMVGRGQRAALAATFAAAQMEQLRLVGCRARRDGSAVLLQGAAELARTRWTWDTPQPGYFRARLVTTYPGAQGRLRADTMEASLTCVR